MNDKLELMNNKKLTLQEHQAIMLRLLSEFHEHCEKNNLRYYLTGGTLLGAVRHKGFIPWDDDVDVVMPRPDYDRFIQNKQLSDRTQVVSYVHQHNYYHPYPYCNVIDAETIMIEHNVKKQTGKGVFIDVFPLDGVPNDKKDYKRLISSMLRNQSLFSNIVNKKAGFSSLKNAVKTLLGSAGVFINEVSLGKKIDRIASKYCYNECNKVAHLVLLLKKPERFVSPKDEYDDFVMLDFEGQKFRCPAEYDSILKRSFGDYMQLPPENERLGHHGIDVYFRNNGECNL